MKRPLLRSNRLLVAVTIALSACGPNVAMAATIFASGQLLIPGDPGIPPGQPGHDDSRENYVYAIDTLTGTATTVSPITTGLPAAFAGTSDQRLLGFSAGELREIDPATAVQAPIGVSNGLNATGFEVLPDGRGFLLPFDANFDTQQLFSISILTGSAAPISASATEIGDAIDNAAGNPLGTSEPFLISLGAVGNTLYGVDLDTDSLIALDPSTGTASVIGAVGAVASITNGPFTYSGFAALTGVDENEDGEFDALFGAVNFIDNGVETSRLGGVARYDLTDGTWQLVGTNPGIIFFGFGSSPVPEPGAASIAATATMGVALLWRRRKRS